MKTLRVLTLVLVTFPVSGPLLFAVEPDSVVLTQPFALDRVTLLDGPFKKAMEINRA